MKIGKEETKINIISSAKKVFLEKGFFETYMENIAEEAGLAKRTLYRYFKTREDLAYEVAILILEDWNNFQKRCYLETKGQGIEKLQQFLGSLVTYMSDKLVVMRFLGEFDFYFKDGSVFRPEEDVMNRFNNIIHVSEDIMGEIFKEGIKDESIDINEELEIVVATISTVLWSFAQRIAIRSETIKKEFDLSPMALISCQINLYIKALKA